MSRQSQFGPNTLGLKRLIRREIGARRQRVIGTVISQMTIIDDDGLSSATWVVDVSVGKVRPYKDVPVKAGADGSRFYAALGQTVELALNTQGRYDVIGPGDRRAAIAVKKTYVLGNTTPVTTSNLGVTVIVRPYEFLKGPTPGVPGTSLYGNGTTPFKSVTIVDGDGNPI